MRQRNRIIEQCIAWLRMNGSVMTTTTRWPAVGVEMKSNMEELIHHFKLFTEGFHVPPGEAYAASSTEGEFGIYLVSMAQQPYRLRSAHRDSRTCRARRDGAAT